MFKPTFTYDSYTHLLGRLLEVGYTFKPFPNRVEEVEQRGVVYLRHDIDLDPHAALHMAMIERKLGIKATYFFMVTNPIYNVFSPQCYEIVYRYLYPQHDVGVHVDAAGLTGMDCARRCTVDASAFERYFQISTHIVSFHRPSERILEAPASRRLSAPRLHTYVPELFRDIGYFSDSGGRWRNYPLHSEEFKRKRTMQILVHPEWWGITEAAATDRLDEVRARVDQRFDTHVSTEFRKVLENAR